MDILLFLVRLLFSIFLYVFLGAVLILLWRDVKSATRHQAAPVIRERPAQLRVVHGYNSLSDGAVIKLESFTTLGRAESNNITVADPYASGEHALLAWRSGQWWLEDRDSRNGTLLNDIAVEEPLVISHGDVIGIGQVRFKFELCDALEPETSEKTLET